jgi:hypothetical protein
MICCPFRAQNTNDSIPQALPGAGVYQAFSLPDFAFIRQSEAWLCSENAAGLQYLPVSDISFAEAYMSKNDGNFINYYQSDNSYKWGALTESYYRLNPLIVFYGKVNYSNFNGKNMGGSAFINPYYNVLDIVETTDDTRGTKNLETYNLIGAVSANLSKAWSIGGKVDYKAANYAKFKDLRHVNSFFDVSATVGISYQLNQWMDIGVNYFYRRSVESIEFKMYGTTDKRYFSLVNFGSFYGRTEEFGENGYTEKSAVNPTVNTFNGASLQLNLKATDQWHFFNELSYKSREGYYGKRSPSTPVYTEHKGSVMSYSGVLSFRNKQQLHVLNGSADREKLENFENVWRKENTTGGRTDIVYYGNTKVLNRTVLNANVGYTANLNIIDNCPEWTLSAEADWHNRQQTVSQHPFYRKQTIRFWDVGAQAGRNIVQRKSILGFTLGVSYGSGGGTAKNDGTYITVSSTQEPPKSLDSRLEQEYKYLTAKHFTGNIGVKYSFPVHFVKSGYVRANYELTNALGDYFKNQKYSSAFLAVGCMF